MDGWTDHGQVIAVTHASAKTRVITKPLLAYGLQMHGGRANMNGMQLVSDVRVAVDTLT